ncbi:MAG: sodium:solute symporter [Gemmatimonadales bacterium]
MRPADLAVVVAYLLLTLGIGLWVTRRQRTASDYFLGSRDLPSWTVLLSIVATETSALTVISVPGIGARGDLTFLQLPIGYLLGRILVARWLLPGYFAGEQDTAYARFERRFGLGTRRLLSGAFLVTRFLGDGVRIFAGAIPLALVTGWSVPVAIVAMGAVTVMYTWFGGLKAVVWADVVQLAIYVAGGVIALVVAADMAGGAAQVLEAAGAAGKLRIFDFQPSLTATYTFAGGLIGGALLSAASHGTDHLIVQRLLATRSLRDARRALIGSGVAVFFQFLLFLVVGVAIWAAGEAPEATSADQLFPRFVATHLPVGAAGLVIAGILAAAMSTISSSINALGSAVTHDFYVGLTGRREPEHLMRVGRLFSAVWGLALIGAALWFHGYATGTDTPVVVLALSIASVTYGALLGSYVLAGRERVDRLDVGVAALSSMGMMLVVVFAGRLAANGVVPGLAGLGRLAWPWYVPLGTALTVLIALGSSTFRRRMA